MSTSVPPELHEAGPAGACGLGAQCTAKDQELTEEYRCRHCNKQLHGFISGCSQAKNPRDFRDGVVCKNQPCVAVAAKSRGNSNKPDGAAIAKEAGLPEFLWETQASKRKKNPNAPKQRRQRYSKEHKAIVLDHFQTRPGSKLADTARQFNIPEGTVRGWFDEDRKRNEAGIVDDAGDVVGDPLNMDEIQESIMLDPTPADIGDGQPTTDLVNIEVAEERTDSQPHEVGNNIDVNHATPVSAEDEVPQPPQKKKQRRQRYSNETKIQVILALETRKGRSLNDIAREFNVAAGTVRGWRDEADKIQKQAMENRRAGAKANPSRDPLKRIWSAILILFEKNSQLPESQRLEVNVAVVRTIGTQARDTLLAAHEKSPFLTPTEVSSMEKFKASETWARKWAKDHQIFTSRPDKISRVEIAHRRLEALQKMIGEYEPDCVYTVTSMELFYRIVPHRTYVSPETNDGKRLRVCKGLKSKDRLTLYVAANETGSDKLPISTIGKYENPACFRVAQQKTLPYFSQKHALSDPSTFQMWWRTLFLPHIRKRHPEGRHCLLLVEGGGNSRAEYLKDPTGQVRVEPLPISPTVDSKLSKAKKCEAEKQAFFPQCQALEHEILDTIKRRYRFRLLQEVMEIYGERKGRQQVAETAQFPLAARGMREGSLANICDSMRLLESIWEEVAHTTVAKAWQRARLRPKPASRNDANATDEADADPSQPKKQQHRAKSEKRQNTREKKQLVKDLSVFLTENPSLSAEEAQTGPLENMVEKLRHCCVYADGGIVEEKDLMDSMEDWIDLETTDAILGLQMAEIKEEMNIEYLCGLKHPIEGAIPDADEGEDDELEDWLVARNTLPQKGDDRQNRELELSVAVELAGSIKATACKLFEQGHLLGELAVNMNEAADSVFAMLRQQKEAAIAKEQVENNKAQSKKNALARKARKAAEVAAANPSSAPTQIPAPQLLVGELPALDLPVVPGDRNMADII